MNLKHEYIPKLLLMEMDELAVEPRGKDGSAIFDATPCMGGVFAFIVCYIGFSDVGRPTV
jgi:hypothetical protein